MTKNVKNRKPTGGLYEAGFGLACVLFICPVECIKKSFFFFFDNLILKSWCINFNLYTFYLFLLLKIPSLWFMRSAYCQDVREKFEFELKLNVYPN